MCFKSKRYGDRKKVKRKEISTNKPVISARKTVTPPRIQAPSVTPARITPISSGTPSPLPVATPNVVSSIRFRISGCTQTITQQVIFYFMSNEVHPASYNTVLDGWLERWEIRTIRNRNSFVSPNSELSYFSNLVYFILTGQKLWVKMKPESKLTFTPADVLNTSVSITPGCITVVQLTDFAEDRNRYSFHYLTTVANTIDLGLLNYLRQLNADASIGPQDRLDLNIILTICSWGAIPPASITIPAGGTRLVPYNVPLNNLQTFWQQAHLNKAFLFNLLQM